MMKEYVIEIGKIYTGGRFTDAENKAVRKMLGLPPAKKLHYEYFGVQQEVLQYSVSRELEGASYELILWMDNDKEARVHSKYFAEKQ